MDDTVNALITPKTIIIVLVIMFVILAVITIIIQQSLNETRQNRDMIVSRQENIQKSLDRIDDKLSAPTGDNTTTNIFPS